ncbi:MAG: DMT family transporter [Elusimicrobiota bacterium]
MATLLQFIFVSALWGGSFLFMRIAGPELTPIPLIFLRVTIGGLFLLPFCLIQGHLPEIKSQWNKASVLGLTSAALPFSLLAYTTIRTSAGHGAIINSTAPFFTALVAWIWLKNKLKPLQILGLVLGFLGVFYLVKDKTTINSTHGIHAIIAGLMATFLYGFSVNYMKKYLSESKPMVVTTISQLSASLILMPFAFWLWPAHPISLVAWGCVLALGIGTTAIAFVVFYQLIGKMGPSKAIVVTFFIPIFGMLWGWLFLNEKISFVMILATGIILFGSALSLELIKKKNTIGVRQI